MHVITDIDENVMVSSPLIDVVCDTCGAFRQIGNGFFKRLGSYQVGKGGTRRHDRDNI